MQGKAGQRGDSGEDGEGYGIANGRYQGAGKQRTGDDTDIDVELAPAGGLRGVAGRGAPRHLREEQPDPAIAADAGDDRQQDEGRNRPIRIRQRQPGRAARHHQAKQHEQGAA